MSFDPYDVLGVERDASDKEIAAAAKRHAKVHHPDKGGDRETFEAGRRALVVLKDPKKRDKFDRTGSVDEESVDNDMTNAMQIIVGEFAALINNYMSKDGQPDQAMFDLRKIPVFERMKLALGARLAQGAASVRKAERQIEYLRDVAERISIKNVEGKPSVDFVGRALEEQIRGHTEAIDKAKEAQRTQSIAIELLSIYSFRFDEVPATTMMPMFGGSVFSVRGIYS
jgi:curved DNA-binding protein CbpA